MRTLNIAILIFGLLFLGACSESSTSPGKENLPDIKDYPIVSTNQTTSFDNLNVIAMPSAGDDFYGQNSNYPGTAPQYVDNGDGTVTDMVTGLMWTQSPDLNGDGEINYDDKISVYQAEENATTCSKGGYDDWRLPTIKELYSLVMFYGVEPNPMATSPGNAVPFIDTNYFGFGYGDLNAGERIIDAQYASSTIYASTTMNGNRTMFGFNFADGRIKGYPTDINPILGMNERNRFYILYVRGNTNYGTNNFTDNGDGTVTDAATGLMWMKDDNGNGMAWEDALSYAENFEYGGYSDWRLPNAKELQSILDYTRSPATSSSPAIDPIFNCTPITNEAGEADYPCFWTNTTFSLPGEQAVYFSFGRAMGFFNGSWTDVHGAGAQRSDPKTGDPNQFPYGHGPQGDAIRIYNYVRLVRNISE